MPERGIEGQNHQWNVCVLPKFIYQNSDPWCVVYRAGTLGRWLGHKGEAFMNEIRTLIRETIESSLIPLAMCKNSKMANYTLDALVRLCICWCLDLSLPSLQNCKKINVSCLSHPVCDIFVIAFWTYQGRQGVLSMGTCFGGYT